MAPPPLAAALVLALASAPGAPPPAPLDTAAIDRAIRDEMTAARAPGAAVAIVRDGRVVYARGYGVRSVETGEPVAPSTLFRIGSTTKMVTGLAALLLARDGRVDLHAPIARVAPGLDAALGARTLHELLTHRGGLTNEAAGDGPHDDAALERRVRGWGAEHLLGPAGDVYSYSGPGYWLAGHAIARAGGAPYADVVQARVLAPLGMARSTFRPLVAMTWPLALDHRVGAAGAAVLRPFPDDVTTWASGSLFSSAEELARLAIALLDSGRVDGRAVLPPEVVAAMHRAATPTPGSDCGYSYGLAVCRRGRVRTLSHYGFRAGTGSVVTLLPDERAAVVLLANRNGGILAASERAILAQLAPGTAATDDAPPAPARPAVAWRDVPGAYANGPDTLRVERAADGALRYRYGADASPARADSAAGAIEVLDGAGRAVQRFLLVRGDRSGAWYLHDGMNAFRRVDRPAPPRGRGATPRSG